MSTTNTETFLSRHLFDHPDLLLYVKARCKIRTWLEMDPECITTIEPINAMVCILNIDLFPNGYFTFSKICPIQKRKELHQFINQQPCRVTLCRGDYVPIVKLLYIDDRRNNLQMELTTTDWMIKLGHVNQLKYVVSHYEQFFGKDEGRRFRMLLRAAVQTNQIACFKIIIEAMEKTEYKKILIQNKDLLEHFSNTRLQNKI